ncbi:hypothetical protein BGW38_002702, partial [Lunasporangiospora selenospora]
MADSFQNDSASQAATVSKQSKGSMVAVGYEFCDSCQMEVRKDDMDRHRKGTAHLMSQESPIKPLDSLTLGHKNKGFKMLLKAGWDYDKGLGVEGQG